MLHFSSRNTRPTRKRRDEVSTVAPFAGLPDQTEHRLHSGARLVPSIDDIDPPRQVEARDWQNHRAGWRARPPRTEAKAPPPSFLCPQPHRGGKKGGFILLLPSSPPP